MRALFQAPPTSISYPHTTAVLQASFPSPCFVALMPGKFQAPPTSISYPHTAAVVSAKYRPQRQQRRSISNRIPRNPDEQDERGISGSDVLRALQRAAAQKKKVKQQRTRELSPAEGGADNKVDLSEVRDLQVKSEWSSKLDELEKRLRELDDAI